MAITTLDEILDYLEISRGFFQISAVTKTLSIKYDSGVFTDIVLTLGSYDGDQLATQIKTKIDAAFTIASTVSYSSTTRLFSITAPVGHTFTYDHSASDAGLIVGFNKDHAAALTLTSDEAAGDPTAIVSLIKDACEEYVSSYCNRTFEETAYSLERYSGMCNNIITLRNYPVIAVDRVVFNTLDAIRIKNTNSGTSASVSTTATGLRLVYNGTADTTVTYASNATIADVVSAVNAVGSGWAAEVNDSTLSTFKSTDILKINGLSAIDSNWVYLQVPDEGLDSFEVDTDRAQIFRYAGWPKGYRNIYVDYTAGYSSADMPAGLKHGVKMLTQYIYRMIMSENLIGIDEYFSGKFRTVVEKAKIPRQVLMALDKYRRVMI